MFQTTKQPSMKIIKSYEIVGGVYLPLWKMMGESSAGMMTFPTVSGKS